MRLECDHPNHIVKHDFHGYAIIGEVTGRTRGECVKQARADGWIFHRDGKLTCPDCGRK